jgi:hypothetical protein
MRILSSLVIATMLARAVPASAQDFTLPPVPQLELDEPDVGKAISPMKKGQRAPFTGILLSVGAVADLTVHLEQEPKREKIQLDRALGLQMSEHQLQLDLLSARSEADASIAKARLDAQLKANDLLVKRVNVLESEAGNTTMWFGIGFAGGVVVTIAIVYAASQAAK